MSQLVEFQVSGNSMKPFCEDGQTIVVDTTAKYDAGDVIAFRHPFRMHHILVKRIAAVNTEKQTVEVRGDNSKESTDSRTLGSVLYKDIIGKVIKVK